MAVRTPIIRAGRYCGSLTVAQQDLILSVRNREVIESLKNKLFAFPSELVLEAVEMETSVRELIHDRNIDVSQYVGELRDYQTIGTAFMYFSPRSIIGDGVGLGKTAEICGLLNILKEREEMHRFLMAVENSAIGQTWMEIMKFTGMRVILMPSTKDKLIKLVNKTDWKTVDGIIITHSTLSSSAFSTWLSYNLFEDGNRCKIFDTFILDESSVIKNNNTVKYKYVSNLCRLAKRVHFMNATIFEMNIMDIYYQVDMMEPTMLPSKSAIDKKFSVYKRGKSFWKKNEEGKPVQRYSWDRVGYKNQEVFKKSLEYIYLARKLEKDNNYLVYEVVPTNKQLEAINSGFRYNEVLNSPNNIIEAGIPFTRKENPKLDRLCSLVDNELQGQQIMIYCFHIDAQAVLYDELVKIGRKPVILNGQDKSKDKVMHRLEIIDKFNSKEYDVIITNIMKSLNLYNGDVCILYSIVGNPSKQTQITGRIDRNVDEKKKTFILILYKHTPEEKLYKEVAGQREMDSRSLTIDAKGAVSRFMEVIEENEGAEQNSGR